MTRTAVPFSSPDLSALARYLERTLSDHQITHGRLPGHVEMMNVLARSIGKRNLQALQAEADVVAVVFPDARRREAGPGSPAGTATGEPAAARDTWFHAPDVPQAAVPPEAAPALGVHARKALQHFDAAGRLERWPVKFSVQKLALWVLWTRFDGRRTYTEAEVNGVLKAWHTYGDHATLRRELIDHHLMTRRGDCSEYRKLPVQPDADAQALLRAVRALARQRRPRQRPSR